MFILKNKKVASDVHEVLIRCNGELNDSIVYVRDNCTEEEFLSYRKVVGKIMGEIVVETLMPLYKEHPELDPEKK